MAKGELWSKEVTMYWTALDIERRTVDDTIKDACEVYGLKHLKDDKEIHEFLRNLLDARRRAEDRKRVKLPGLKKRK